MMQHKRFRGALAGCTIAAGAFFALPTTKPTPTIQRVYDFPDQLGEWQLLGRSSLDVDEISLLGATDQWRRAYAHAASQQVAMVTLVSGPSGPLTSHQPELCYARQSFQPQGDAWGWFVPKRSDQFRIQTFAAKRPDQHAVTTAFAWHDGHKWRSPALPRFQLAGHQHLSRLQVSIQHPLGQTPDAVASLQELVTHVAELEIEVRDSSRRAQTNQSISRAREDQLHYSFPRMKRHHIIASTSLPHANH